MAECKPFSTLISTSKTVVFDTTLYDDPTQYRSLAGALQYLTVTRPNLSFSVNQLCQHMHSPTVSHWEQLKRVLRYVKGTITFGLRVRKSSSREINAFSDSDWAGCPGDRKSTSGFVERHWTSPAMAATLQALINTPQFDILKQALRIAPRLLDVILL
ncbi:PREDICTED: uncharacterized protein LOC109157759 [Ipomoea nil]|uniref:uncharacterized protein LOC109157759 n=1 Tax=Ipomoea nil TaxID=35883 RepID=UPI00090085E8|nr:PREDICTED: uncharacterized protein LOC109157759 [Ipomoea nil]